MKLAKLNNRALRILAGPGALRTLQSDGVQKNTIGALAGASGGPKWLVLSGLDPVLADFLMGDRSTPIDLIGSSIGAWRMACFAQRDPLKALLGFRSAYVEQAYSEKPDRHEITRISLELVEQLLGPGGADDALCHPSARLHILTVRSRALTASDTPLLLAPGLLIAAALNAISRRLLRTSFERVVFHDARSTSPILADGGFRQLNVELSDANLGPAIVASGAIPLLLAGVRDIVGAPKGRYRDGGITDYHLDIPMVRKSSLCLYPHFYPTITPGWFDKRLKHRAGCAEYFDRTIVLAPSAEFVAKLPGGKIPDRQDFVDLTNQERQRRWRDVVAECQRLGDELAECVSQDLWAEVAEPLILER